MLLRIASDLHLEFYNYSKYIFKKTDINDLHLLPVTPTDSEQILCLSGDVCCTYYLPFMKEFFENISKRFKKVIVIYGNHEFFKGDINDDKRLLKMFYDHYGIITLDNENITIDGVNFFGATFWTDMDKGNPITMSIAMNGMPDYRIITKGHRSLFPKDTMEMHEDTFQKIREFNMRPVEGKKVVMTHHCPSWQSVAPRWKTSPLTPAFASEYDWFIEDSNIDVWLHGHTHDPFDYMIDKTRIICNPAGYFNENPKFNKQFIIEI